jgi:hypothetical protein
MALRSTQPPITGNVSTVVKGLRSEIDHSLPSNVEIKSDGFISPLPHTSSWNSSKLIRFRDNFTFVTFT